MKTLTNNLNWRTKGTQFYQSFGCGQVHNNAAKTTGTWKEVAA